jgi:hypothetical protein
MACGQSRNPHQPCEVGVARSSRKYSAKAKQDATALAAYGAAVRLIAYAQAKLLLVTRTRHLL